MGTAAFKAFFFAVFYRLPMAIIQQLHPGALVVAASWSVQQLPVLPSQAGCALSLASGCILLLASLALRAGRLALLTGSFIAAAGWAAWVANQALAQRLSGAQNGQEIVAIGLVQAMAQSVEHGQRFRFLIEQCIPATHDCPVGRSAMISWYSGFGGKAGKPLARITPGQRWQFALRLRQPRASLNPGLFDAELRALQDGISLIAHVRSPRAAAEPRLLADNAGGLTIQIERLRDRLRDQMRQALGASPGPAGGVLVALVIGDQAAIEARWWEMFNRTGIGHLMSISGLHITMLAGLAGLLAGRLWRSQWLARLMRGASLVSFLPAPHARWLFGLIAAFAYSALAGWGIPAQRTCWMLAVAGLAMICGRGRDAVSVICTAGALVCVMDPWAPMAAGFWLSFAAVAAIIWFGSANRIEVRQPIALGNTESSLPAAEPSQANPVGITDRSGSVLAALRTRFPGVRASLGSAVRTQYAATLVLLPLGVLFFSNVSLVSPFANAFAIPLVSALITPLAMLASALLPVQAGLGESLLTIARLLTEALLWVVEWLDQGGGGAFTVPLPTAFTLLLAAAACAVMLAPMPLPGRALAGFALLPMLLGQASSPAEGELKIVALDIGQGTAVLLEIAGRRLLYDTGPRLGPDADAGSRVIVPYLRARGIRHLDAVVVSHQDSDHAGGAMAVLRNLSVDWVASSLPQDHPVIAAARRHYTCRRGDGWQWGDTRFSWLHPGSEEVDAKKIPTNARSCVLRIENSAGVVLLTGDIELRQEKGLLQAYPDGQLRASVLLAPHHGSRTSSSEAFLDAVAPQYAVFQIGFRNRYHHPNPQVLSRYLARGIKILRSDDHAAIEIRLRAGKPAALTLFRRDDRRYWRIRQQHPA